MDFKKDEYVVYRNAGVCQLIDIDTQSMDGEHELLYYKLKPLADQNSTYYIPVDKSEGKLRKLLTVAEVLNLIDNMPDSAHTMDVWSDNRRERKELYSQIMKSDDQMAMLQLIASLYFRKQSSEASGKRFSAMDESAMKNAETLMLQEFGVVLQMEQDELRNFIDERVTARQKEA